MKKYTLLIIIGGLFLMIGVALSLTNKNDVIYYVDEENMTKEEISSLIIEKSKAIIDIFENQKESFEIDNEQEENEYLEVSNYDLVIDALYTENGKKELEKTKFNNKLFINKNEDKVYILKSIPNNNLYSNCSILISNIDYNKDVIKATVSFTKSDIDSDNELTYHVYEKNIELIKKEDKWLVNNFIYTNA